ncbi:MAG: DinB family protein [Acidobacteriales bacterium]|nr:DinB family protein [Terriglobales bacterium]
MDLLTYLRRLFAYNHWANQETLAGLQHAGSAPQRSRKFIAHVVAAEWLWLRRLKDGKQMAVWPELTLPECEREVAELQPAWNTYLSALDGKQLAHEITYTNSIGGRWTNNIADVLMHVAMHSAYHRGQIASDMRQAGHTPAYTDFIHCVRQGFLR